MTVTCKNSVCPYYNAANFCSKPIVVNIDENGMCGEMWRKGAPRNQIPPVLKREVVNILEANIKDEDKNKADKKEGAGADQKIAETAPPHHEQSTEKNDNEKSS